MHQHSTFAGRVTQAAPYSAVELDLGFSSLVQASSASLFLLVMLTCGSSNHVTDVSLTAGSLNKLLTTVRSAVESGEEGSHEHSAMFTQHSSDVYVKQILYLLSKVSFLHL